MAGTAAARVAIRPSAAATCSAILAGGGLFPRSLRPSRSASRIVRPSRRARSSRSSTLDGLDTPARIGAMTPLTPALVLTAADELLGAFAATDTEAYFSSFSADATFVFHPEPHRLDDRAAYEQLWASWLADG